jgi:hypothetical protein
MNITKEDYLKLLEEMSNNEEDLDNSPPIEDESWIWADPPVKDKIKISNYHGVIDATKFKKEEIQDALYKCMNIQIGNFLLKIDKYHGFPDTHGNGSNLTLDIQTWEKKYRTPSGNPCNMDFRVDLSKDDRFANRPWINLFNGCYGSKVPVETVVEIVRWLQAIKRMTAFL